MTRPEHIRDREQVTSRLAELLSSKVRAALLVWWASRLDVSASLTELSRATGMPVSSLQHECYKLERLHLLTGTREGGSRRYTVSFAGELTRPLVDLTVAAIGRDRVLTEITGNGFALAALIEPKATSGQRELLLVGDASLDAIADVHRRVELVLGTPVGLAYVQASEWHQAHPLYTRLTGEAVTVIVGENGALHAF